MAVYVFGGAGVEACLSNHFFEGVCTMRCGLNTKIIISVDEPFISFSAALFALMSVQKAFSKNIKDCESRHNSSSTGEGMFQ